MNSYFRAGWVLRHLSENSEALKAFGKAIEVGHSEGLFNSIYQEALYWSAVTLECENKYLDAIELYRVVTALSDQLKPESKYRELLCLISVGKYHDAVEICSSFEQPRPDGFSSERYAEIKNLVNREKSILELCYQKSLN
jgi:tetratricopeptide (TPR) repeat protein